MNMNLRSAIATYGASTKAKFANAAASGEPEEQLRAPLEQLIGDLAVFCGLPPARLYEHASHFYFHLTSA
jgi:hypothetical protein